jgi:Lipocalin-like domain
LAVGAIFHLLRPSGRPQSGRVSADHPAPGADHPPIPIHSKTRYIEFSDGHRETQYGEHPQGLLIILPNGWYSHVIMRDDLPRYGSGNMRKATDEEAQAAVVGSLPHLVTWTLDEHEGTLIAHILGSILHWTRASPHDP